MKLFRKNKKGFSLIELLLVLGTIAVIAISAFMIYQNAKSSQTSKEKVANILIIKGEIKSIYSSFPSYEGINTDVLVKGNVFPPKMLIEDSGIIKPVNSFKGNITVTAVADNQNGTDSYGYVIKYFNVTTNECIKIVTAAQYNFDRTIIQGSKPPPQLQM